MKGVDSNWGSFFQNSSYIQWGKKGRGWKYFDNNNNEINREKDVAPDFEKKKNGKMQPTRTKFRSRK